MRWLRPFVRLSVLSLPPSEVRVRQTAPIPVPLLSPEDQAEAQPEGTHPNDPPGRAKPI